MCYFCFKHSIVKENPISETFVNGWFFPCMVCGAVTSNQITYMVLLRKDVDTITVHGCNRCKDYLKPNTLVRPLYTINRDPHTELRFYTTRVRCGEVS